MLTKLTKFTEEREKGFTLIELLVVILIIGILSAIAIPAFLNQRKSAVDASVQSDLSNVTKQVETLLIKLPSAGVVDVDTDVSTGVATIVIKKEGGSVDLNRNVFRATTKVSDGTIIRGRTATASTYFAGSPSSPEGYVIFAKNSGGDKSNTGDGFVYKSNQGGLQR